MRRYPVKLVGASKPGTNFGELSGECEAEKSRKHLSKHIQTHLAFGTKGKSRDFVKITCHLTFS